MSSITTPSDLSLDPTPSNDVEKINALMKSLNLAIPLSITTPKVSAAYHTIYILSTPPQTEYVLRVCYPMLPSIKTKNEVAILSWVNRNTKIPVPEVFAYSSSADNALGQEYVLLSKEEGETLSDIYTELDEQEKVGVVDQLIDFLLELHSFEWNSIGGLVFKEVGEEREIIPGPVLEETFWQVPDIEKFWPLQENLETLNIKGPYSTYVEYISAHIRKYVYAISLHNSLIFMRDSIPLINKFLEELKSHAKELNNVKLKLAHKDLHFGNILYSRSTGKITSILDWEFAGIVPFTRWDPVKAFLWNGRGDGDREEGRRERERWREVFEERCRERGVWFLVQDAKFATKRQEMMQSAANYLRAVVEVAPRSEGMEGERTGDLVEWKGAFLRCIGEVGR